MDNKSCNKLGSLAANQGKYMAYGCVFESEIALPELLPADGETDVRIVLGCVPKALDEPMVKTPWCEVAKGQYLLKVDGIARYHVVNGSSITIEPYPGTRIEDIKVFLFSSVFAVLLQQREYLVLHGAAVVIADKGVVLAGPSAVGKTAIALNLYDRGFRVLADEICAIHRQNGKTIIYPGMPQLYVWQDTLIKENKDIRHYQPIRQGLEKYAFPVEDQFCTEAIELSNIVLLTNHNRDTVDWQPIKGAGKFAALMGYSYRLDLVGAMVDKAKHFQLCTAAARTANIAQLTFNGLPYKAGQIVETLLKELKR